jgi:hypothetical protein
LKHGEEHRLFVDRRALVGDWCIPTELDKLAGFFDDLRRGIDRFATCGAFASLRRQNTSTFRTKLDDRGVLALFLLANYVASPSSSLGKSISVTRPIRW